MPLLRSCSADRQKDPVRPNVKKRSPAAGRPDSLRPDASRRGKRWSPGNRPLSVLPLSRPVVLNRLQSSLLPTWWLPCDGCFAKRKNGCEHASDQLKARVAGSS